MKIIEKDILTVDSGIICQQVNCQGKMNSGLAKSIREKWPNVYSEYLSFCKSDWGFDLLGKFQKIKVSNDLFVGNIFGQYNFGYDNQRYTDYCALNISFQELYNNSGFHKLQVYFPMDFACCRGGGDWRIVSAMIEHYFPEAIICKL